MVDEKEFANDILEERKTGEMIVFVQKITHLLELSCEESVETRAELRLFD